MICSTSDTKEQQLTSPVSAALPYIYSNSTLLYLDGDDSEVGDVVRERKGDSGKYAWSSVPTMPWSWNEDVWAERLFHCIRDAVSNELQAVPAYSWSAQTYKGRVASLFPNVLSLPVAPFQGMTDILLLGKHAAVVTVSDSALKSALQRDQHSLCP